MGRHLLHVLQQNTRKQKRHTKSAQYSLCKMMSNKGRATIQESPILKFSFIEFYIKTVDFSIFAKNIHAL